MKLFISYSYIGMHVGNSNIYQGFGSSLIYTHHFDKEHDFIENCKIQAREHVENTQGFDTATCEIFFYKKHDVMDFD